MMRTQATTRRRPPARRRMTQRPTVKSIDPKSTNFDHATGEWLWDKHDREWREQHERERQAILFQAQLNSTSALF